MGESITIKRGASRNSRSKGIKIKYILQICLLFAVCFWLIYQLKCARDTKRELNDNIAKFIKTSSSDESLKFGRKDLHPYKQEAIKNDKTEDNDEKVMKADEDEQTKLEDQVKQEESKYEEEDQDEDKSQETDEKSEDDEVDANDQEKIEEQNDQDEDLVEGEKERGEEDEEQLAETNEVEGKDDEVDHETLPEDQDPDVDKQKAHEAREENYKADDASSAVSHVTQNVSIASETINSEDKDKNFTTQNLEDNNGSINRSGIVDGVKTNLTEHLHQGKTAEEDLSANLKTGEKDDEPVVDKSTTSTSLSNDQAITSNQSTESSTEVDYESKGWSTERSDLALLNKTQVQNPTRDSATREVSKVQDFEAALLDNKKISDSTQSVDRGETTNTRGTVSSKSSSSSESTKASQTIKTEAAAEVGTKNTTEASHLENSDMNYVLEETNNGTDSAANNIEEAIQRDPIDASDSTIDLSTLAADDREVVNRKDAAGE